MMNKQKTGKAWRWKVATFLPLLALLLMAFGREGENEPLSIQPQKAISIVKNTQAKDTTAKAEEKVYFIVEEMPEFPGGEKALREYIAKSIQYPVAAKAKNIQGKVYVNFIVDAQGKVTNPKIARGVDPDLDAEALRVVSALPQWSPGKQKGKPMRVSYTTPVYFVLSSASSSKTEKITPPPPPLLKIEIRKDGNYIDNRLFSLEEIRKKAKGYAGVSIKVDKDVPQERVNELKEVLKNTKVLVDDPPPTTSNSQQTLITEHKPNGALPPSPPLKSFNIEIRKDGNYIDNRLFSKEELAKKAEEYQKSNPNAVVSINRDEAIPQERFNEIKEVLRNANILNVKYTTTAHKTFNSTEQQSLIKEHKTNDLPPPPPPRVMDKGLQIILDGELIRVKNQPTSMEELEKMIAGLNSKEEFVEIITNSSTNKTVETKIKELLEKQNISYRITWGNKW